MSTVEWMALLAFVWLAYELHHTKKQVRGLSERLDRVASKVFPQFPDSDP